MPLKSSSRKKTFKVLSRKTIFRGYVSRLDLLKIRTASGREVERELILHPGAVVIIPRLPDGRLILIHQLRVATGGKIWEFPAGTLEKGEPPAECAARELQEETCWKPGRLRKMVQYYPTPGLSNELMYLYLADRLSASYECKPDPDEELEVAYFSVSQIEKMIRSRRIIDGKTILGFLLYLRLPRKRLAKLR